MSIANLQFLSSLMLECLQSVSYLHPADLVPPAAGDGAGEDGVSPLLHRHVLH